MTTVTVNGYLGSAYYLKAPVTELIVGANGHIASKTQFGIVSPPFPSGRYTVINDGIVSAGTYAVYLRAGGLVKNGSTSHESALIEGQYGIVNIGLGTVVNFGTVETTGTTKSPTAIILQGGTLTNGSTVDTSALVSGYAFGANIGNMPVVLSNFGTITSTGTKGSAGVWLSDGGGRVNNGAADDTSAVISGFVGIQINAVGASITNFGLIEGDGGVNSFNVALSLTNLGTIEGAAGTVVRPGDGSYVGEGVLAEGGGRVTNGSATNFDAVIEGANGIYTGFESSATTTETNFGTIQGDAGDGVKAYNQLRLTNGSKTDGGATVSGTIDGVIAKDGPSSVVNFGQITGEGAAATDAGVTFKAGGAVTNEEGATITGANGIVIGPAGTVTNLGEVRTKGAVYAAIELGDGGVVTNGSGADTTAVIQGGAFGVTIGGAAGTIKNYGTLSGGTAASSIGVSLGAGGTLENFGTIEGMAYAATFGDGGVLAIETGSDFVGAVSGGGAATLELAARSGVISGVSGGKVALGGAGPAQSFEDFASLDIVKGATFTLTGSGTIGSGGGVSSLTLGGNLYVTGSLAVTGTLTGSGLMLIEGGEVSLAMASSQNVTFRGAGQLALGDSQDYGGTIAGFAKNGTTSFDLQDIGFGEFTNATYDSTSSDGGELVVTDGTDTATIKMTGNYVTSTFTVSSDGDDGTIVTIGPAPAPAFASAMAGFAPSRSAAAEATGAPASQTPALLARPAGS